MRIYSNDMLRNSLALVEKLRAKKRLSLLEGMEGKGDAQRKSRSSDVKERIRKAIRRVGQCWIWTGKIDRSGYGKMWIYDREFCAHRVVYTVLKGDIPDGLTLDHLKEKCGNRACVNPDHLEPVTMRENVLRGNTFTAANLLKTHCPRGHEYSEKNIIPRKGGGKRGCRICANLLRRIRDAKPLASPFDPRFHDQPKKP